MKDIVYALIFAMPDQRKIIEEHCFGDCGKVCMGIINDAQLGEMMPCGTGPEECPYLDKELPDFGTVENRDGSLSSITLRKLQPVKRVGFLSGSTQP
jgi:hypothetical protein